MKKSMFIFLIAAIFALPAHAQWKARANMGGSYYAGNVDKFNIQGGFGISRTDSIIETALNTEATYSETDQKTDNQQLKASLKLDYKPYGVVSPFTVASYYNNKPKGIEYRVSGMAGAKYTFYNKLDKAGKEVADYSISAALQYDREKYIGQDSATDKGRISIRPKFEHQLNANVSFSHITFFIPKWNDYGDYIIDSKTALASKLTKKLFFELSYQLEYLSVLPELEGQELKNTDHAVLASFKLNL